MQGAYADIPTGDGQSCANFAPLPVETPDRIRHGPFGGAPQDVADGIRIEAAALAVVVDYQDGAVLFMSHLLEGRQPLRHLAVVVMVALDGPGEGVDDDQAVARFLDPGAQAFCAALAQVSQAVCETANRQEVDLQTGLPALVLHAVFQTPLRVFEGQVDAAPFDDLLTEDLSLAADSMAELQRQDRLTLLGCASQEGQAHGQQVGDGPDRFRPICG